MPHGVVDGSNIAIVAACFGSCPRVQPPLKWNANCDVNNDDVIDGLDIAIVVHSLLTTGKQRISQL